MATAHFVKSARKPIYNAGKQVSYVSERGKRMGQTLYKTDKSIPANSKDTIFINVGESYYWWQFKNSPKQFSKTSPTASQLTQSAYLSTLYDIQDRLSSLRENVNDADELSSAVEEITSDLQSLLDDTQESLDAMPEHLQESSSSGELLSERISSLESAISEIEGVDLYYDEPSDEDLTDEAAERDELDPTEDELSEARQEKLSEWLDEKCEELSNVSFD